MSPSMTQSKPKSASKKKSTPKAGSRQAVTAGSATMPKAATRAKSSVKAKSTRSVTVRCRATNCPPHTGEVDPPRCSNHKKFSIPAGSPDPQWTCGTHNKHPCASDPDRKGCGPLPGQPPASSHPYVKEFKNAAKRAGVPVSWATDQNLVNLLWKESMFDKCKRNLQGSTATGLFMVTVGTWYAYAPNIPHGTFDAEDQAYVGFLYIQDRYGSPTAAWAYFMKHGNY